MTNEIASIEYLQSRKAELITSNLAHWAMAHRTIRGRAYSFHGHWYLYDIFCEQARDVIVRKSAQCFPAGTKISTPNGYRPIETVKPGDTIYTATARKTTVKAIASRIADDLMVIQARPNLVSPLRVTANHKLVCIPFRRKRKWGRYSKRHDFDRVFKDENVKEVACKDLMVGDFILMPGMKIDGFGSEIDKYRLLGLYASEGYVRKDDWRIGFCFHLKEKEYGNWVENQLRCMKVKTRMKERREDNCLVVNGTCRKTAEWLVRSCGQGSGNKHIPAELTSASEEDRCAFLRGVFEGDGTQLLVKGNPSQYRISSVSRDLIDGIHFLLNSIGIVSSVQVKTKNCVGHKDAWNISVSGTYATKFYEKALKESSRFSRAKTMKSGIVEWRNYFAVRIHSITKECGSVKVHNLETESPEHSYIANGVAVKNCGISDYLISTALWLGDHNWNTIYVMPTDEVLNAFIHGRIDPAIQESEYLRKLVIGTDNIGLKQVRRAFVYFRAYLQKNPKKHKLKTIDADCCLYDEFDELGPDVRALGEKRLGHSSLAWERAVSTPTYPDMGIDREWQASDQREWHIRCEHCGEWQTLSWPDSVVYQESKDIVTFAQVICKKCKKPIDRLQTGEWVAKYPDREKHGYHVNKLMCEMTDMAKLIKNSKATLEYEIQEFHNSDLGVPYAPKGAKLTIGDLMACRAGHSNDKTSAYQNCWMGIDVGKRHNVMIGHGDKILYIGQIDNLMTEGAELMEIFDVAMCVIDANPELHLVREFQKAFTGRVRLAYYWGQDDKRAEMFEEKEGEAEDEPDTVHINRTALGDYMVQTEIKMRKMRFPRDIEAIPGFIDQMRAPTRVLTRDSAGNLVAKWLEYGKPDHYFHAGIYSLVARFIFDGSEPTILSGGMDGEERDTHPNKNYDADLKDENREKRDERRKPAKPDTGIKSVNRESSSPDW